MHWICTGSLVIPKLAFSRTSWEYTLNSFTASWYSIFPFALPQSSQDSWAFERKITLFIFSCMQTVAPDDVVVDCTFASHVKRVMRSINFANFQIEWLICKCYSLAFLSCSKVARFEVCGNVVLVVQPHGNVPFHWKWCKGSLKNTGFKKCPAQMYCVANVPEAWSIFSEKWQCFLWRSCAWCFGEEHEIGSLRSGARFQIHRLQRLESSRFQEAFLDLSQSVIFCVNAFNFHDMRQFLTFWIQINRQSNHV